VLVVDTFGVTHYGEIFAIANAGAGLGGLVGPLLAGYVFDTTGSYKIAFLGGAGISLLAILFTRLRRGEQGAVVES
jgi:MFS family permease